MIYVVSIGDLANLAIEHGSTALYPCLFLHFKNVFKII